MSYPLPSYHFIIDWGGSNTRFSEVSGLDIEIAVVEYRDGSSPEQHAVKMPGQKKFNNIILKRPVQTNDADFFSWINTVQMNTVERRDLTISLLDESHQPVISWRIKNAWPCKYQVSPLKATGNEVAMETIELAHEGLRVVT